MSQKSKSKSVNEIPVHRQPYVSSFSVCELVLLSLNICLEQTFLTVTYINLLLTINGFCFWFKKFFPTPKAMKILFYVTLWIFRILLFSYSRLMRLNCFLLTVWGGALISFSSYRYSAIPRLFIASLSLSLLIWATTRAYIKCTQNGSVHSPSTLAHGWVNSSSTVPIPLGLNGDSSLISIYFWYGKSSHLILLLQEYPLLALGTAI